MEEKREPFNNPRMPLSIKMVGEKRCFSSSCFKTHSKKERSVATRQVCCVFNHKTVKEHGQFVFQEQHHENQVTMGLESVLAVGKCRHDSPVVTVVLESGSGGPGSFFFGETVRGTVCVQGARSRFRGAELTVAVEGRVVLPSRRTAEAPIPGTYATHGAHKTRFDVQPPVVLWHGDPGTAPHTFALATPRGALCFPPSFDGRGGAVHYCVRATLCRPLHSPIVARTPLVLVPHVPLTALAAHAAPVRREFALRIGHSPHANKGRVAVALGLSRAAFVPHEDVTVWATLANHTSRALVQALVTLTQDCVTHHRRHARTVTTRLATVAAFPAFFALHHGQATTIVHTLTLPACTPSFAHPVLAVSYRVALVLHTRSAAFECSIPFVVGSEDVPPPQQLPPPLLPLSPSSLPPFAPQPPPLSDISPPPPLAPPLFQP